MPALHLYTANYATAANHAAALSAKHVTAAYHAMQHSQSCNAALSIMQWQHIMQQHSQCDSIKPLRISDFAFTSNICLITPSVTLNLVSAYMYQA